MVNPKSAILGFNHEHEIPMNVDFRDIAKWTDPADSDYRMIITLITSAIKQYYERMSHNGTEQLLTNASSYRYQTSSPSINGGVSSRGSSDYISPASSSLNGRLLPAYKSENGKRREDRSAERESTFTSTCLPSYNQFQTSYGSGLTESMGDQNRSLEEGDDVESEVESDYASAKSFLIQQQVSFILLLSEYETC